MMNTTLRPGSDEAISFGCVCTSEHNNNGAGWYKNGEHYGWDVAIDCPIHGIELHVGTCRFCGKELSGEQTACWQWKCKNESV
jgi:hypothetical protein